MAIEVIIYSWKQTCLKHQQLHIKLRIMTCNFLFIMKERNIYPPDVKGLLFQRYLDRCLEPVDYKIDIDYFKDLDMNKTAEEKIAELDEDYYLEGTSFDTEVLIHNEVLVNLPMKVLCRENCKGICNRCGANLNLGSCKCDDAELDPRMSKILDIFNQFKEV